MQDYILHAVLWSTSVARAGSSLFPRMPCMVGRSFITPKDSWVTRYLSCPRPSESVVQPEILPTPTLSPWTTLLLTKWCSHLSNFNRKKPHKFLFLHFGSRRLGFPMSLEKTLVYCKLGCGFTALQLQCTNFPCAYSQYASKQLCSVAAFPRCTMQSFSYNMLKWVDRYLAHF